MKGIRNPERAERNPVDGQRTSTKMRVLMMLALVGGAYFSAVGEGIALARKGVNKLRGEIEKKPST